MSLSTLWQFTWELNQWMSAGFLRCFIMLFPPKLKHCLWMSEGPGIHLCSFPAQHPSSVRSQSFPVSHPRAMVEPSGLTEIQRGRSSSSFLMSLASASPIWLNSCHFGFLGIRGLHLLPSNVTIGGSEACCHITFVRVQIPG